MNGTWKGTKERAEREGILKVPKKRIEVQIEESNLPVDELEGISRLVNRRSYARLRTKYELGIEE